MSVCFYGCITMDGYLADKQHRLDWLEQTGSLEETDYDRFYQSVDITIMGKRTYLALEQAGLTDNPYPTTRNYVLTHSKSLSLNGFIPVDCDAVELVRRLGPDPSIWIIGGTTLLSPLLDHDMVDRIILQIAPVLLGDGIPLFSQKEALKRFSLSSVRKLGPFAELVFERC